MICIVVYMADFPVVSNIDIFQVIVSSIVIILNT